MPDRVSLLVKIFKIELEESENDIQALMDYYAARFENLEITPYVWQENRALLLKEVSCIKELEVDLRDWVPPEDNTDILAALHSLKMYLQDLVIKYDYPEVVKIVIDRISEKVSRYIE
ncbi:MAG: hypothetical protein DRP70_03125 [Spirochaetes bacterium]|nr:MAG: hypothetical protein DRP70_03125 [Spirochaetota bacterium]